MDTQALSAALRGFLDEIPILGLATVDEHGEPHATNLYFAAGDALELYFLSNPEAAHCRHAARHPGVAATVHARVEMWQQVRGVQLRGVCAPVAADRRPDAEQIYVEKFPHMHDVPDLLRAMTIYRIAPTWVRWIDNSKRFGYKVETDWPPPRTIEPASRGPSLL